MRALGLEICRGDFIQWFRWHNIRGSGEQLLAHGVAVEDWHGDIRTWECWQSSGNVDCGVACFWWRDFVVELVFGVLRVNPEFDKAREFLALLNIEMSTRDE